MLRNPLLFNPRYSKVVSLVEIIQMKPINPDNAIAVHAVWMASLVVNATINVANKVAERRRLVALIDSPMSYSNGSRFLNARIT